MKDKSGKPYTVRYEAVNAMLLNEFLKEHQKVEEQSSEIAELKAKMERLEQAIGGSAEEAGRNEEGRARPAGPRPAVARGASPPASRLTSAGDPAPPRRP